MEYKLILVTTVTGDLLLRYDDLIAVLPVAEAQPLLDKLRLLEEQHQQRAAELRAGGNGRLVRRSGRPRVGQPTMDVRDNSCELRTLMLCAGMSQPFCAPDVARLAAERGASGKGAASTVSTLHRKGLLQRVAGVGSMDDPYRYQLTERAATMLREKLPPAAGSA
jgi:hypothetical protein